MSKLALAPVFMVITVAVTAAISVSAVQNGPGSNGPECRALLSYLKLRASESPNKLHISRRVLEPEVNNQAFDALVQQEPDRAASPDLAAYRQQIAWRRLDSLKACSHIKAWAKQANAKIQFHDPQFRSIVDIDRWYETNHTIAIGMPALAPDGRVYFDVSRASGLRGGSFGRAIMKRNSRGNWVLEEERIYAIS